MFKQYRVPIGFEHEEEKQEDNSHAHESEAVPSTLYIVSLQLIHLLGPPSQQSTQSVTSHAVCSDNYTYSEHSQSFFLQFSVMYHILTIKSYTLKKKTGY